MGPSKRVESLEIGVVRADSLADMASLLHAATPAPCLRALKTFFRSSGRNSMSPASHRRTRQRLTPEVIQRRSWEMFAVSRLLLRDFIIPCHVSRAPLRCYREKRAEYGGLQAPLMSSTILGLTMIIEIAVLAATAPCVLRSDGRV